MYLYMKSMYKESMKKDAEASDAHMKKNSKKNLTGFSEEEEFVALRHKKSVEA